MKRFIPGRPTPAMVVAIIALIAALGGSAVAAGVLTKKKFKKQAVRGPVTYVSNTQAIQVTPLGGGPGIHVKADCPGGTTILGGGIKLGMENNMQVNDSHPTVDGWAGTVYNSNPQPETATITAICARSRLVTGKVPPN
jgi:hypothetical protein